MEGEGREGEGEGGRREGGKGEGGGEGEIEGKWNGNGTRRKWNG